MMQMRKDTGEKHGSAAVLGTVGLEAETRLLEHYPHFTAAGAGGVECQMVGSDQDHEFGGEGGEPVSEDGAFFFEVSSGGALSDGEAHWGFPFSRGAGGTVLTALDI